jgi:pimeloyl-ACP methyl ester carboxylesterase
VGAGGADGTDDADAAFDADPGCFGVASAALDLGRVRCGYVRVPLDHDDPQGPTIRLAVAVLPATDPDAGDTPVVVLEGGPGGHLVEPALTLGPHRERLELGPETVLVDQRGVGLSEPALECPGYLDAVEGAATHPDAVAEGVDALSDCHDRLVEEGIDPQQFHSEAVAADVDAVRAALGYDEVHLRGGSYGAEVALRAADANPEGVASLVLSSPADPVVNWLARAPAAFNRGLHAVADACDAHADCVERHGDLRGQLDRGLQRLVAEPPEVRVRRTDGTSDAAAYPAAAAVGHLRWLLYLPPGMGPERLPAIAAEAADGDYTSLATLGFRLEQEVVDVISHGMHHAVRCTGHGAELTAADLRESAASGEAPRFAEHLVAAEEMMLEVCEAWDVEPVPGAGSDGEPPAPDVPALVVTGEFDPITPPAYGGRIADRLPASRHVEVPDVGHAALEHLGDCGQELAGAFIADPGALDELDASCATERTYDPAAELEPFYGL